MAEQSYNSPAQRNTFRAGSGGPTGSNQGQGRGELPGKVSVPLPGTDKTQPAYKGGTAKSPAGFNNGLISGKV